MAGRKAGHIFSQPATAVKYGGKSKLAKSPRWCHSAHAVEALEPRQMLSLTAPVSYTIGATNDSFVPNAAPVNIVTADFNGDRNLDLAVAKTSDNSVYISLGNGNGTFK